MSYTDDPANNVIDRLRLKTGDTDPLDEGLSDDVYQFLLDTNDQNENVAALEALKALVAKYANCVTEKAGGLFIKGSEKYEQYKKQLEEASNPVNGFMTTGAGFTGGIYCDDMATNAGNSNINHNPFSLGDKSSL